MQTVEHYAKRRSQKKLGRAAILIWEEQTANVQTSGKPARKR
jgi:hypothetical protein